MGQFRFYAELNDFLPPALRGRTVRLLCDPHASVKHAVEALGVPHTEVGLLLLNGQPCPLSYRPLCEHDRVAVYPPLRRLAPAEPPEEAPRFIADAHLGRLARYLRFAGYDTRWHEQGSDAALAACAREENRVVLTRDRALLMHRDVARGCYLWPIEPLAQLHELAWRLSLDLRPGGRPGRCLMSNAVPLEGPKAEVAAGLPPRTREAFERFWRCPGCRRVYWHGSHWRRMHEAVSAVADRMPA